MQAGVQEHAESSVADDAPGGLSGEAQWTHAMHVWFLESMDRVNRAIQGTNDVEHMMSAALDAVVRIFECDRAVLKYPCDPHATRFHIPMRRARPGYLWPAVTQGEYPAEEDLQTLFGAVRSTDQPVAVGAGAAIELPALMRNDFCVQSALAMAVYP